MAPSTPTVAPAAETVEDARDEPAAHLFGLWDGETPVGLLALVDWREDPGPEDDLEAAYLWRLLIAPEHEGRGHGRAAVRAAMDWARARGLRWLVLTTVPGNARARRLYERAGLRETGRMVDGEVEFSAEL